MQSLRTIAGLGLLLTWCAAPCCLAKKPQPSSPGWAKTAPEGGRSVAVEGGHLVPYRSKIPGTDIAFEMIPIPGGVVRLGPAAGDPPPEEEGFALSPPMRVVVEPFWIGKCEVTWAEYWRYMELDRSFTKLQRLRKLSGQPGSTAESILKRRDLLWRRVKAEPTFVDGVTSPTPLYEPDVTYESGEEPNLPAVTMTQYAARQYTKWLSLTTGVDYRLPTEAEWEHAAKAGGEGRVADINTLAWNTDNADYATHPVGGLQPNAWGLHDTLGNVAEWVLDDPRGKPRTAGDQPQAAAEAVAWPSKAGPRMAKGGYWDAAPELCIAASRLLSDDEYWKGSDPQLPKSPWWYTDYPSHGVGFRLMRPYRPMDKKTRQRAWEIDNQDLQTDIDHKLRAGDGKLGRADPELPKAMKLLEAEEVTGLLE